MSYPLKATYRNGTFILQTTCNLPEGTEVELLVRGFQLVPPVIFDADTKKRFLKLLIDRMQQNQIPLTAPHFTREMLHERR